MEIILEESISLKNEIKIVKEKYEYNKEKIRTLRQKVKDIREDTSIRLANKEKDTFYF